MRTIVFIALALVFSSAAIAQSVKKDYALTWAEIAVSEMHDTGIPASITLAQGILESGNGKSQLAAMSNNHFGIKCHKGWTGESVRYDDDEAQECFRKYPDARQSFKDHSAFLSTRGRYAFLFSLGKYDYKAWAHGLKKAGYATDPQYAYRLIKIIEREQLFLYDTMSNAEVTAYVSERLNPSTTINPIITASTNPNPPAAPRQTAPDVEQRTQSPMILGPAGSPEPVIEMAKGRNLFFENEVEAVWAHEGDSPNSLAQRYNISVKKLKKYNEWPQYQSEFTHGMKVYLKNKKKKTSSRMNKYHEVKAHETIYQIAQSYGLKTKSLLKLNGLSEGQEVQAGEMLYLQKKRKSPPRLRRVELVSHPQAVSQQTASSNSVVVDPFQNEIIEQKVVIPAAVESKPEVLNSTARTVVIEERAEPIKVANEEQPQYGRAIIYDDTPVINTQPAPTYAPPQNSPTTTVQTIHNPVVNPVIVHTDAVEPRNNLTHKVISGDTLWGLSKKYNVSVADIKAWNNLSSNTIKMGQRIIIKK